MERQNAQHPDPPDPASQVSAMTVRSVRPASAAAMLGVCRDTVYVLMRAERLRSVKIGRARLIPLAAIEEFLAGVEQDADRPGTAEGAA